MTKKDLYLITKEVFYCTAKNIFFEVYSENQISDLY